MTSDRPSASSLRRMACALLVFAAFACAPAQAADEPDPILRRSTVFKWLHPTDKLAHYGIQAPGAGGGARLVGVGECSDGCVVRVRHASVGWQQRRWWRLRGLRA